ncbi:hypothetical protein QM996_02490 [Sinorhizobium chiapasense]
MGLFVYFLFNDGSSENKWMTFMGSFLLLICTRLADLLKVNLGKDGFTAEMQAAIDEAKATVTQLHALAELFAKVSVEQVVSGGRWGGTSRREKRLMIESITDGLKSIGLTEAKIAEVRAVQEPWDSLDYFSYVSQQINTNNDPGVSQLWNTFYLPYSGTMNRPSLEDLERWINANHLMTDELRERLTDWRHYRQHKTHRRRDVWEGGHQW